MATAPAPECFTCTNKLIFTIHASEKTMLLHWRVETEKKEIKLKRFC